MEKPFDTQSVSQMIDYINERIFKSRISINYWLDQRESQPDKSAEIVAKIRQELLMYFRLKYFFRFKHVGTHFDPGFRPKVKGGIRIYVYLLAYRRFWLKKFKNDIAL